ACSGLAIASMGIVPNANGVFYTPVSAALNVGRGAVALCATITGITQGLFSPLVNSALKKLNVKKIIIIGSIITAVATVLMARANSVWIYNLLGFFRGLGSACFYYPLIYLIIGNHIKKGRSTIIGFVMSMTGIAGALFSPLFSNLINNYGYQVCYIIVAALILIFCFPAMLILKIEPSEMGPEAHENDQIAQKEVAEQSSKYRKLRFFQPLYILVCLVFFSLALLCGVSHHFSGYAESIGFANVGALMLSAVMVGNLTFKFIIGAICDKANSFVGTVVMAFINIAGALILLLFTNNIYLLLLGSFLFGVIFSVTIPAASTVRSIYGDAQFGQANSTLSMFTSISASVSITVVGYIYDLTNSYSTPLIASMIIALLCILAVPVIGKLSRRVDAKS
ncbi:MAG: MFS transporter, partial [Chloroflexi bacterium]|nr:MFS transporter [Chloroflexota bacterium]